MEPLASNPTPRRTPNLSSRRYVDRVAIVTGGGSGIGLATARRIAGEGGRIVLADLDPGVLVRAEAEVRSAGAADVLTVQCDVSLEADVERSVSATIARFGRLDLVVNNAGVMVFKRSSTTPRPIGRKCSASISSALFSSRARPSA